MELMMMQYKPAEMPLIMDIGMNNARDSEFYLRKGFRVVAVEASPRLAAAARERLASWIDSGQLIIEQVGLSEQDGFFTFYANLDNDHWSSFRREWGTRNNTRYEEIEVICKTPQWLISKHGMPYYLKIDIEGNDLTVLQALNDFPTRPRYVSVEEGNATFYGELWAAGCRHFKIVDQSAFGAIRMPEIPREGNYVDAFFDGETSGPFGDEAPGEWETFDISLERYLNTVRSPTRGYLGPKNAWFDIHGRFG